MEQHGEGFKLKGEIMQKPKISVFDTVGFGLIIAYPTGVIITNQTGGFMCEHPEIEGVYLPLRTQTDEVSVISPANELNRYFVSRYAKQQGLDEEDIDFIHKVLKKYRLDEFISVDKTRANESHEAWIYVTIHNQNQHLLSNFPENLTGVITWQNSD